MHTRDHKVNTTVLYISDKNVANDEPDPRSARDAPNDPISDHHGDDVLHQTFEPATPPPKRTHMDAPDDPEVDANEPGGTVNDCIPAHTAAVRE